MIRSTLFAFALAASLAGCKKDQPAPAEPMVPPTTDETAPAGDPDPMNPGDGDGGGMPGEPTAPDPMNPDTSQRRSGGGSPHMAFEPMQAPPDGGGIVPGPRDGGIGVRDAGGSPIDAPMPPGGARDAGIPPGADGGLRPNPGPPPSPR